MAPAGTDKAAVALEDVTYTVAVSDKSSTNGFVLQKLQHRAVSVTAPTFVGSHSVSITLTAGRWLVMPRLGKATYSIVVS